MERAGRQVQQLLSVSSTNQSLTRSNIFLIQPNTFLQYFYGPRAYCLNSYILCFKFLWCEMCTFPISKGPCLLNKRFWSGPTYSRVATAASASGCNRPAAERIRPLFCWWAARRAIWEVFSIERVTTSACSASSQSVKGEQKVQNFSQQHKHCATVRWITDHKGTPRKYTQSENLDLKVIIYFVIFATSTRPHF